MNNYKFISGFLTFLIGISLISCSSIKVVEVRKVLIDHVERKWVISHVFHENDVFYVDVLQDPSWKNLVFFALPTNEVPYDHILLYIDIRDPCENVITYEVTLVKLPSWMEGQLSPLQRLYLSLYRIRLIEGDNRTEVDDVKVKAKYNGTYTIEAEVFIEAGVPPIGPDGQEIRPPPVIQLLQEVIENNQPYAYLLPVGAGLSALGIMLLLLGIIFKGKKYLKRKHRT
jgi:hypothetical protein